MIFYIMRKGGEIGSVRTCTYVNHRFYEQPDLTKELQVTLSPIGDLEPGYGFINQAAVFRDYDYASKVAEMFTRYFGYEKSFDVYPAQ